MKPEELVGQRKGIVRLLVLVFIDAGTEQRRACKQRGNRIRLVTSPYMRKPSVYPAIVQALAHRSSLSGHTGLYMR